MYNLFHFNHHGWCCRRIMIPNRVLAHWIQKLSLVHVCSFRKILWRILWITNIRFCKDVWNGCPLHNTIARCCHIVCMEFTIVGDNNMFSKNRGYTINNCLLHLFNVINICINRCCVQNNQINNIPPIICSQNWSILTTYHMFWITWLIICIIIFVRVTGSILDMRMVFASLRICLAQDLDCIVCDIDFSFLCCHHV